MKISLIVLLFSFMLIGCSKSENLKYEDLTEETSVDAIIETTETTTDEVVKSNFDFLKTNSSILTENEMQEYSGYNRNSLITDVSEIEYEEFNTEVGNKKYILNNEDYTIYYYERDDDYAESGNVYVIDNHKSTGKPTILAKGFFGFHSVNDYTGEYFITENNILWVKFSNVSKDNENVQDPTNYTDDDFFRPSMAVSDCCEDWCAIDLSVDKGAIFGCDVSLTKNKKYYYYVYRNGEDNKICVGYTSNLNHVTYNSWGYPIVAEDGTLICSDDNTIYSIFIGSDQLYQYAIDGELLYVSESAIYAKNDYGIIKYTNSGQNLVIKFIDYGKNAEVLRYIIDYANSPYILIKSSNGEQIVNLDDY